MDNLAFIQYPLIGLVFIWSGFVRSGLGFGGAVLTLPFLLLIDNRPLVYLPIISVHLIIFSSAIWIQNHWQRQSGVIERSSSVDWNYLKKSLAIMIVPKLVGVFGLLTLPAEVMGRIIFTIVGGYAISYIINKPFTHQSRWIDAGLLVLGAYFSGTSLIGAPLIMIVYSRHVAREQLRDTLFALWFVLVCIKLAAFLLAGVDLQLKQHVWLLPCAALGHFVGLRFHTWMLKADQTLFYRVLGCVLLLVSVMGWWKG